MTDKELKKLGRAELLEMLLNQSKEVELLKQQLEDARVQLRDRQIKLGEAGSIAEAALKLNGIFESAQQAAEQYLENIADLSERQNSICAGMEKESREKADMLLSETKKRCEKAERETEEKCAEMTERARAEAKKYWDDVSEKLEDFYASHAGLQELLAMRVPTQL